MQAGIDTIAWCNANAYNTLEFFFLTIQTAPDELDLKNDMIENYYRDSFKKRRQGFYWEKNPEF